MSEMKPYAVIVGPDCEDSGENNRRQRSLWPDRILRFAHADSASGKSGEIDSA